MVHKVYHDARAALDGLLFDGMTIMSGGFGLSGTPEDLIRIMGPNSARFVDKEKDIGTLEPGKLGDIVVLGANPLDGFWNFTTAVVVIKGGEIVVDKRGQPGAGKPTVLKGS